MINTRADFLIRINEIDKYFDFLLVLDGTTSNIHSKDIMGTETISSIDNELVKMLKANGFLLLYNLIESTVVKSIQSIFNNITDKGLTFSQLSENLKKLWINNKTVNLKGIDEINFNRLRELMRQVAESIVANEIAQLDTACVSISGNIDAQEARSIAKQFGFDESSNGRHLVTIKNKRNNLAHGDFSFSDIGKDYTVNDLVDFKINAYDYLQSFMSNIEAFIRDDKFSNTPISRVA